MQFIKKNVGNMWLQNNMDYKIVLLLLVIVAGFAIMIYNNVLKNKETKLATEDQRLKEQISEKAMEVQQVKELLNKVEDEQKNKSEAEVLDFWNKKKND